MIILYVGIILILYSLYTYRFGNYKTYVAFGFCLLIMGFQSGVLGDYYGYKDEFENFSFDLSEMRKGEYFWVYLLYYCQQIMSWPIFLFLLSAFECYAVRKFVYRFSDKKYIFTSAILFFFAFNYMLMQMKAMRQGLAVDLCMLSFVMIDKKDIKSFIYAIVFSAAAYFTHKSCAVCLLFVWAYWIYSKKTVLVQRNKVLNPFYFSVAMIVLYFIKKAFLDSYIIPLIEMLDDDHYMNYASDFIEFAGQMNFLPILYNTIMVSIMAWYLRFADYREQYFVIIAIIGVFVDTLVFATGSVQRLLLYFLFANLVVVPGVSKAIDREFGKVALWSFWVLLIGYAMKTSLPSIMSTVDDKFGNYQFIFMQ